MKFKISQTDGKHLFEATLEPKTQDPKLLGLDEGEAVIDLVRGKTVRFAVGTPYFKRITSELIAEEQEFSQDVLDQINKNDFHFVSMSCSFRPDPGSRFVWARLSVELTAISESGNLLVEKPIVWSMFPREILAETFIENEIDLNPKLDLTIGVAKVEASALNLKKRKSVIVYEPEIFSYGIKKSSISWDFRSTEQKGIWGNKDSLLLVIRTPKNSSIEGRFFLSAQVEFNRGKWIPIAFSKRKDDAIDISYPLSE